MARTQAAVKNRRGGRAATVAKTKDLGDAPLLTDDDFTRKLPDKGQYFVVITGIERHNTFDFKNNAGDPQRAFSATVNLKVSSESEIFPGYPIRYVQIGPFNKDKATGVQTPTIKDLLRSQLSDDEARSVTPNQMPDFIQDLIDGEAEIPVFLDWNVFSISTRDAKLLELTELTDIEQAKKSGVATREQWAEANAAAQLYSTQDEVPTDETDQHLTILEDPTTKEDLYVNIAVRRIVQTVRV